MTDDEMLRIQDEELSPYLNKDEPPFVPDGEGDAPPITWFSKGWVKRAFDIQKRNGTLLKVPV